MTWESFWAYFNISSHSIKSDLWEQIDLENHLKGLSSKHQIEVLTGAEDEIIRLVENCLHLETRIKLGKKQEKAFSNRTVRLVLG